MSDLTDPVTLGDQFLQHTHDALSEIREHSPARRIRFPDGGEGWLITRFEDVKAISSDPPPRTGIPPAKAMERDR